tara:strand:- start:1214 stop:1375 length:162 start_codon:yes stop_codon:yes gene_type:complete
MNFLKDNIDVLTVNTLTIGISLSNVEQILQIIGLTLGIIYTLDKYIHYRKNRK